MAAAGRTLKLGDDLTVSALGFGAGRWHRFTVTPTTPNRWAR
jgi:hypothetical protein